MVKSGKRRTFWKELNGFMPTRPAMEITPQSIKKSFTQNDPVSVYIHSHSIRMHPVQQKLMDVTLKHSRNTMMGDPVVLQLIQNLLRTINAKKVLDIGVFTGMSSLASALAIPDDGRVIALDVDDEFVNIGRSFWKEAGVDHKIEVRIQHALDTLDQLIDNGEKETFDFAFIDADKQNYSNYYERCVQLVRSGGIIALDNVLWGKLVIDLSDQSERTVGIREVNDLVAKDDRVNISMLNIADGLTLAFKK